jgi:hypothetical protein
VSGGGVVWGSDPTLYVEIQFDTTDTVGENAFSSPEVFSRKMITTVPFAFHAATAASALSANTVAGFSVDDLVKFAVGTTQTSTNANGLIDLQTTGNVSSTLIRINENGAGTPHFMDLQVAGTSKFSVDNQGRVGLGTASPTAQLHINTNAGTSGTITMSATSGNSTFTTSASITLQAGDYIIPALSSFQTRVVTIGGTGTSFTVSPAFTGNVTNRTFIISRKSMIQGPRPVLSLSHVHSPFTSQEWQLRVGAQGVTVTPAFDIYNATTGRTALRINDDGNTLIGSDINYGGIGNASRLYVYGGSNGANIDVMGEGVTGRDQATIELQASDWETSGSSAYMQAFGPFGLGTSLGVFNNQYLGRVVFQSLDSALIYTTNTTPLVFGINNGEKMRLTDDGFLGIGETNPTEMLHVSGSIRVDTLVAASGTAVCINADVLSTCSSSLRYKEQISELSTGMADIMKLRPVTFKWKDRGEYDFGFVAEEVEQVNTLYVSYYNGRLEGVKYPQLTSLLTKGMQEQEKRLQELEVKMNSLNSINTVQPPTGTTDISLAKIRVNPDNDELEYSTIDNQWFAFSKILGVGTRDNAGTIQQLKEQKQSIGWNFIKGDSVSLVLNKSMVFQEQFSNSPIITVSIIGTATSSPSDPGQCSGKSDTSASISRSLKSGFDVQISRDTALDSETYYCFSWIAVGSK